MVAHFVGKERESWEQGVCQGLGIPSQGHTLNDLTNTLQLCQAEDEDFNAYLFPHVKHSGTKLMLPYFLGCSSFCSTRSLEWRWGKAAWV